MGNSPNIICSATMSVLFFCIPSMVKIQWKSTQSNGVWSCSDKIVELYAIITGGYVLLIRNFSITPGKVERTNPPCYDIGID